MAETRPQTCSAAPLGVAEGTVALLARAPKRSAPWGGFWETVSTCTSWRTQRRACWRGGTQRGGAHRARCHAGHRGGLGGYCFRLCSCCCS